MSFTTPVPGEPYTDSEPDDFTAWLQSRSGAGGASAGAITEVLGVWDAETAYSTGDVVSYTAGPYYTLFRATGDSTGEVPAVTVEGDTSWEFLAGQGLDIPYIVYQAGVNDPSPVGDLVDIMTTNTGGTATGGTVTFTIEYADGAATVPLELPFDFDAADVRAVFDAFFGSDSTPLVDIVSPEPGAASIQGTSFFASHQVTAVEVTDDSITWDGAPGTPLTVVTNNFPGVGVVPGFFLASNGQAFVEIGLVWYRLISSLEMTSLLTEFATSLEAATTIGEINDAATALLADL